MRLFRMLCGYKMPGSKSRPMQDPTRVPFKPVLVPMKLKNRVSGKVDSQSQVACLHELSVLFAKLKETDFNEKKCTNEIDILNKAHIDAMNKAREDKLKNAGQITTTGRLLNSKQLNRYLKKFSNE